MGTFYEFFAGGGMARAGLGENWECLLANDFDAKKADCYAANWGSENLKVGDVANLSLADFPLRRADLAWASFPCQDLSLAGSGAGLGGSRSGTFWPFWKLIQQLRHESRAPRLIVLENVCGALTSHRGNDFRAICSAFNSESYRVGALVIDAVHFLPQSRPRLFIIGVAADHPIPRHLSSATPHRPWHTHALLHAYACLDREDQKNWIWWRLPSPQPRNLTFGDLIQENPEGVQWHTKSQTQYLLDMMSQVNLAKVAVAKSAGRKMVGGLYRRTRRNSLGEKVQRAEVRFDEVAGCLRTPSGGSSRQSIVVVQDDRIRSRLLSPREAARLMGLPDEYKLPSNYNEAYHLVGDGVAVPVVRFLAANVLERLLELRENAAVA